MLPEKPRHRLLMDAHSFSVQQNKNRCAPLETRTGKKSGGLEAKNGFAASFAAGFKERRKMRSFALISVTVRPVRLRGQNSVRYPRTAARNIQVEQLIPFIFGVVQGSAYRSFDERACQAQLYSGHFSRVAAAPAGVHEKDPHIAAAQLFSEKLCIDLRPEREERCAEHGGEGGDRPGYAALSPGDFAGISRPQDRALRSVEAHRRRRP